MTAEELRNKISTYSQTGTLEINDVIEFDRKPINITCSILFKECTFNSNVVFSAHKSTAKLSIQNCKLKGNITIEHSNSGDKKIVNISDIKAEKITINIINNTNLIISLLEINVHSLNFTNNKSCLLTTNHTNDPKLTTKIKSVRFSKNYRGQYDFKSINSNSVLLVNEEEPTLTISKGNIHELILSDIKVAKIEIGSYYEKVKIYQFSAERETFDNETKIRFQNSQISFLNLAGINNQGNIQFTNTKFENDPSQNKNKLNLTNAFLGNTVMTNCNISVDEINLDGAYLMDLKMTGVSWPKNNSIDKDYKNRNIEKLKYLRDTYRQLKAISLNSKDVVNSLKFKANEMNIYLFQLRQEKKWFSSDFVELFLSKWSSNFGLSIGKPLIRLLSIHFIIFFFVLLFSDYRGMTITLNSELMSWDNFFTSCEYYGELLIPIRKFNSDLNSIVDILMRIDSGFFIYHIIKATRKFAKL